MRLRVIAVGTRMPAWVDAAFEDYARRLRVPWRLTLTEVAPARRRCGIDAAAGARMAKAAEAKQILALLTARDFIVPLDERAAEPTTRELASWLTLRRAEGQDLAFIIGGPDGLADEVFARGQWRWSLSRLTLPHALARVVLVEQLYRAASVLAGHPYHRD
ncbi:MAG: 23S rRNA (pseudouridine(1915)-N(3))-methyltransferase RlmH [Steroidobacteraceae bacterium]